MARDPELRTSTPSSTQDGVKVSKSPWGPDDEIGRLNWITQETNRAILEHLDGSHVFDLNVEYFIGMPSWVAAGDPPYGIWMTHTPQGSINDNLSGVGAEGAREVLVLRRLDPHVHALRHAHRHAQPPRLLRQVLERLDAGQATSAAGSGTRAAPRSTRRSSRAACCSTSPACTASTACPTATRSRRDDLKKAAKRQGVELPPKRRRPRAHRPHDASGPTSTATSINPPGIGLAAAKWLCEEAGAMCIAGDSIGLEVLPSEEQDVFLPVHAYMFATAGAQIIEVVEHGGDRRREAVRVRVPRLPAQAARRDGRADALLRGAAQELLSKTSSGRSAETSGYGTSTTSEIAEVDGGAAEGVGGGAGEAVAVLEVLDHLEQRLARSRVRGPCAASTGMPVVANERRPGRAGVS